MKVDDVWQWSDGTTDVINWAENQPDGGADCTQFWRHNIKLDDVGCTARLQYVCEKAN